MTKWQKKYSHPAANLSLVDTLINETRVLPNDSVRVTHSSIRKFSTNEIDSIFRITDRKQQQIDSIIARKDTIPVIRTQRKEPVKIDINNLPYQLKDQDLNLNKPVDFIHNLQKSYFSVKKVRMPVYANDSAKTQQRVLTVTEMPSDKNDPLAIAMARQNPDWLLAAIITLLMVIAWLKLFYDKFFDQTLRSAFNFQLSTKTIRDQNIFSQRVAFVLNMNFVLCCSLFLFLIALYYNVDLPGRHSFTGFLSICGILTATLITRYILNHITGFIFDQRTLIDEYTFHILLTYKNLGVYLLPVVIALAYLDLDYKIFAVYIGLIFIVIAYLLRLLKGLQTIIKKDISIVYLILYLCTLEFLPIIIAYRFFNSLQ